MKFLKNKYIQVLLIFVICVLLEIFFFNAKHFYVNPRKNPELTYNLPKDCFLYNSEYDFDTGKFTMLENDAWTFADLTPDTEVRSIYVDFEADAESRYEIVVRMNDEGARVARPDFRVSTQRNVEETKYIPTHFTGHTTQIRIAIDGLEEGETFSLSKIVINKKIPLHFSIVRVLSLFLIVFLFYGVGRLYFFKTTERRWLHTLVSFGIPVVFVLLLLMIAFCRKTDPRYSYGFNNVNRVDAWMNGTTVLSIDGVDERFYSLSEPHDISEREQVFGSFYLREIWDSAYYDGEFHCYFGVVPTALFFYPYKLLTGRYLSNSKVVWCAYAMLHMVLTAFLVRLLRKKAKQLPYGYEFAMILLANVGTLSLYEAQYANMYVVPYAVGMLFVTLGLWAFAEWYMAEKKRAYLLFFGAAFMALSVGCRPIMLLYSLILVPFALRYMILEGNKKTNCINLVTTFIPYGVIGALLAYYNYIRFDSILEFGQNYQITVNDNRYYSFSLIKLLQGQFLAWFMPPRITLDFPFIELNSQELNISYQLYVEGPELVSLLWLMPVFVLLLYGPLWRNLWKKSTAFVKWFVIGMTGAGVLLSSFITISTGVHARYHIEVIPFFLAALFVLIALYAREISEERHTVWMRLLLFFGISAGFLVFFTGVSLSTVNGEAFLRLKEFFEFLR